jgi:hypothetical protein
VGLTATFTRLAAGTPARCFTLTGAGAEVVAPWLRLDSGVAMVDSPRAADVLLVLGRLDGELLQAAAAVHDAVPPPRGVALWSPDGTTPERWPFSDAVMVREPGEIAFACRRLRDDLLGRRVASSPDALPDVDPTPWRGVGPFGQGGTGMTGGVPYGRPLAGRADDRDGLKLDQILVRVGPFLPPFPPGLLLDVKLQGDVIQEVAVTASGAADAGSTGGEGPSGASVPHGHPARLAVVADSPFTTALTRPVPIAELELARARHHLAWLAEALRVSGLEAYGLRALKLAFELDLESADSIDALDRWLRRNVSVRWGTSRVGVVTGAQAEGLPGGPVARASGDDRDTRSLDPAYQRLGFEPVVHGEGDTLARWRLRVAEARQSVQLAKRSGTSESTPSGVIEDPRGPLSADVPPSAGLVALLPNLLVGMEWGDAVTTVVSLDVGVIDPAVRGVTSEGTGP